MRTRKQTIPALAVIFFFGLLIFGTEFERTVLERAVLAQQAPTPMPAPEFDQAAAIAKLKEQIKGREKEPAGTVFKNIQNFKDVPAGRIPAIMEFGYSRSLGVNCTHCHTPGDWAAETKPAKQIAREMQLMAGKINDELLKNIKGLDGRGAIVNCTTCHRGELKPALNLPMPPKTQE